MLTLFKLPNYETMTDGLLGKQEEGVVQALATASALGDKVTWLQ